MTYEQLGQDDETLSIRHGLQVGVHDAAADLVKYAVIGGVVLTALMLATGKRPRNIVRRILPGAAQ